MKKILFFSVYPAPYRTVIVDKLMECFDVDAFFESSDGDERNKEWFSERKINSLDSENGRNEFRYCKKNLNKYDLVYFADYTCKDAIKLILKCRRKKVPYVINCDGEMLIKHGNFIKDFLKKYLISGAAGYFASGVHAERYFLRYGVKKEKIYFHKFTSVYQKDMLNEPLATADKIRLREKLNIPVGGKIAVAVGRFIPLKRYDALIESWKGMSKTDYLLLIGGGPEKEKYEKIIKALNINNIIIEDFHKPTEIFEYLRAADVFVHPTSYDVWGLVVNEAMASGLPVVVSDTCVAGRELITDGKNGYLVKLYDDKTFIDKVKLLFSDDELRKNAAVNALSTIKDFTVENMVDTLVKNIDKIIAAKEIMGKRK